MPLLIGWPFQILQCVVINQIARLPIIHIKNHTTIIEQETRMVDIITNYITQLHMWVHTTNRTKYLSGSTTYIYIYKIIIELPIGSTNRHDL